MKVSKKFLKMVEVYKIFAPINTIDLDFSDKAAEDMFAYESTGAQLENKAMNGFWWGKHNLDLTVSMWVEDRKKGELYLPEIYEDGRFPKWWLDSVFNTPGFIFNTRKNSTHRSTEFSL